MSLIINPFLISPSAPADPSTISSIWDWWEPSRESLSDNDPISTLNGQFAAKTFTQTGVNRPTFKANILNSLGVADFVVTPNPSSMTGPDASALTAGQVFLVIKVPSDPGVFGENTPWRIGTDGSNADAYTFTDGVVYIGAGSTARKTAGNPSVTTAAWRVLEVITTSSEYTVNIDGTQLFTTGTNTVGFRNGILLGLGPSGGQFTGQIAGLYIFSAKLSSGDRTTMVNYLNDRFALSIS